ncbi:hypothetical protein NKH77_19895 [Streptomyces sp. M19]
MASIVERPKKSGEITYQIKWRQDGDWQTENFGDEDSAKQFKGLVEAHGNRWPWCRAAVRAGRSRDGATLFRVAPTTSARARRARRRRSPPAEERSRVGCRRRRSTDHLFRRQVAAGDPALAALAASVPAQLRRVLGDRAASPVPGQARSHRPGRGGDQPAGALRPDAALGERNWAADVVSSVVAGLEDGPRSLIHPGGQEAIRLELTPSARTGCSPYPCGS